MSISHRQHSARRSVNTVPESFLWCNPHVKNDAGGKEPKQLSGQTNSSLRRGVGVGWGPPNIVSLRTTGKVSVWDGLNSTSDPKFSRPDACQGKQVTIPTSTLMGFIWGVGGGCRIHLPFDYFSQFLLRWFIFNKNRPTERKSFSYIPTGCCFHRLLNVHFISPYISLVVTNSFVWKPSETSVKSPSAKTTVTGTQLHFGKCHFPALKCDTGNINLTKWHLRSTVYDSNAYTQYEMKKKKRRKDESHKLILPTHFEKGIWNSIGICVVVVTILCFAYKVDDE